MAALGDIDVVASSNLQPTIEKLAVEADDICSVPWGFLVSRLYRTRGSPPAGPVFVAPFATDRVISLVQRWNAKARVIPMPSAEAVISATRGGMGLGILPQAAVPEGDLELVPGTVFRVSMDLFYRRSEARAGPVQDLIRFLMAHPPLRSRPTGGG